MRTLILTGSEVRSVLTPATAVDAVERAFAAHARGETQMPPKVYLSLEQFGGDFRAMPVQVGEHAGVKWINAHPDNTARYGVPSVIGVFILSDARTAVPLAIMDATGLTAMRTGAGAAVATRHLARAGASSVGIIGCGTQARTVLRCHHEVMTIGEVLLYDRDEAAATALVQTLAGELPCRVATIEEAAAADVVCTLTPSRGAIVARTMVGDGAHINAMGADAPGKQELDTAILADARVFLDDVEQASESGEVNVALAGGELARDDIAGTLGEVVAGLVPGRGDARITVFDSTGLAVQDLVVAELVYAEARICGIGMEIELVEPAHVD